MQLVSTLNVVRTTSRRCLLAHLPSLCLSGFAAHLASARLASFRQLPVFLKNIPILSNMPEESYGYEFYPN